MPSKHYHNGNILQATSYATDAIIKSAAPFKRLIPIREKESTILARIDGIIHGRLH